MQPACTVGLRWTETARQHTNEMWEGALFSPLAQFGERVWWMPLQPSNRRLGPLDSRFEQGRFLGADGWIEHGVCWHCKRSGEGPNNQTIAARRTMDWQLAGRSTRQRIVTKCTGRRWRQSWDQSACVATTCAVPLPPVVPEFRLVERQCAEPTSRSSATQTIALDVPTREQVVNKPWIIRNSVVPAWKQLY